MLRTIAAGLVLSATAITGFAGAAHAQSSTASSVPVSSVSSTPTSKASNPLKCVGAADHKAAQSSRLQALQSDLAALNARLAAAQAANKAKAVERIQGNITKVNARIATVQANQAKFATRCA